MLALRLLTLSLLAVSGCAIFLWGLPQEQTPAPASQGLTCAQIEQFLLTANIGNQRDIPKGVTLPKRATLDDGKIKHDASIQKVHETKTSFTSQRGTELNFKDWWEFNVAGYEIAKLLDINMVPPYVPRKVGGQSASLTWWVEGMLEVERMKKYPNPPDMDGWNKQMYVIRVFNQLIANSDPNLTNFIIDPNWQIWMIDFSRAFRMTKDLPSVKDLVQCDRKLLAKLRSLDRKTVEEKVVKPKYLNKMELDGLMARRDKIVAFFDKEIAAKGEAAVLYDLPRSGQPCGVGL
jgi:hypothetical protein